MWLEPAHGMDFPDPYIDPATGLLRNKVNAQTQVVLDTAEGDLVYARMIQLLKSPPEPTSDLTELAEIHRHLFQDLYDWAGEIRTVDIRKPVEGATPFMPVSFVHRGGQYAAEELYKDKDLKGLNRDQLVSRLSHHYDQFNYVHPFREGNGRTQRFMFSRIVRDAGWGLHWTRVTGETNDHASRIAAEQQDLQHLKAMFDQIVEKAVPTAEKQPGRNRE